MSSQRLKKGNENLGVAFWNDVGIWQPLTLLYKLHFAGIWRNNVRVLNEFVLLIVY